MLMRRFHDHPSVLGDVLTMLEITSLRETSIIPLDCWIRFIGSQPVFLVNLVIPLHQDGKI